jgi:hypothetical protein
VTGRYYADYSGITANTASSINIENNLDDGTGSYYFDQTGLTNSPKLLVKAVTFKLGSGWGNYSTWNGFGRVVQHSNQWNINNGSTTVGRAGFIIQTSSTTGTVYFNGTLWDAGAVASGIPLTVSTIQSNYVNRWLAFVSATSDTTSTFANWTGGTITARNWCERTILVDIASQTIIGQADQVAPVGTGQDNTMDFSTQAYGMAAGTQPFLSTSYLQNPNNNSPTFNASPYSN